VWSGFEKARDETLEFLKTYQTDFKTQTREKLVEVARTSLCTKVDHELALHLTEICVDAVMCIQSKENPKDMDLHMIEIMHMRAGSAFDTRFVNGLVMDHGARHPGMAKRSENCFIFVCNVSLEYEKTMVNSGFYYKDAEEREKMVEAERKFTDDKCKQIIAFKESVCTEGQSFILINQKGIDPISLDLLQKAGIVGIRRAKRRNMERLAKACGGFAVNSVEDLTKDCLGYCDLSYEHTLGDDKYTFVEGCKASTSCTILIKGPNDHTIAQIKAAIRDGMRAVTNAILDDSLVAGAGAFELAAYKHLLKFVDTVEGRAKIGVKAFAEALLVIPKTLAVNSGLDAQSTLIDVMDEMKRSPNLKLGLDLSTGKANLPERLGIWDNYCVKKQFIYLGSVLAINLMLVDEIMRAGKKMGKGE
jgi:T-complex protein 1 subunit zeta